MPRCPIGPAAWYLVQSQKVDEIAAGNTAGRPRRNAITDNARASRREGAEFLRRHEKSRNAAVPVGEVGGAKAPMRAGIGLARRLQSAIRRSGVM
jgi:hypothetical protein